LQAATSGYNYVGNNNIVINNNMRGQLYKVANCQLLYRDQNSYKKPNLDFVVSDPVWNNEIEVWFFYFPNLDFVVPDRV